MVHPKCRLSLVARNVGNLDSVAEACKTAGASEVLALSRDLSITEECISAVEDTIAHFKGLYCRHSTYIQKFALQIIKK